MAPKKAADGPSKKTENKQKAKVVEDLTFGLKNKNKSAKVQQYVKQVTNQVMVGNQIKGGAKALEAEQFKKKEEKEKNEKQKALIASLFKSVVEVKMGEDGETIDYKRTLCPYFKAGVCEKGKKCKYSHDLTVEEMRTANIDIYSDPRAKLGKVPDTIITCNHFIEAVEKDLYGFNWICPNKGDDCGYRHMLPVGYVLNREKNESDDEDGKEKLTLEEKIEQERHKLGSEGLTPVTAVTFAAWKERRAQRRQEELEAKIKAEQAKGRKDTAQMKFMSGRALFTYNPDVFQDEDGAADDLAYEETKDEKHEIQEEEKENWGEEESKDQEVKVDSELFKEQEGDDEDVDFGDDQ